MSMKIFIWGLVALALVILAITERSKVADRRKYAAYVQGVIVERGSRAKSDNYVAYIFTVDSIQYRGEVPQRFFKRHNMPCGNIGNRVLVRYEKGNPKNNDLLDTCLNGRP